MSGIYIPDMEMPKSCLGELNGKNDCPIVGICGIFKATPFKEKENIVWEQRLKDCPLVEVPPHGDLISKQETVKKLMASMCDGCKHTDDCGWCAMAEYRHIVENAPTILEASTEERE